jgi:hypothetical protein
MMPRQQPTFDWQGDRWRSATGHLIEKRLRRHRTQLAEMLSIDISEQEARTIPADYPEPDERTEGERYVEWRQSQAVGAEMVARIDLAIEEIAAALRRCWALNRDVNHATSTAKARHTLEALLAEPKSIGERWQTCDPETQGLIEGFYPGGWVAMEERTDPDLLVGAMEKALVTLPAASKGRPKKTIDHASRYLGPALAEIYIAYADGRPKRSNRKIDKTEDGPRQTVAYGPFREFVELVFSIVPERLRRTKKGGLKSLDHLVREGVAHLKSSQR